MFFYNRCICSYEPKYHIRTRLALLLSRCEKQVRESLLGSSQIDGFCGARPERDQKREPQEEGMMSTAASLPSVYGERTSRRKNQLSKVNAR
jgi:hypothetical protein